MLKYFELNENLLYNYFLNFDLILVGNIQKYT